MLFSHPLCLIQGLVAQSVTLDMLLKMTPDRIGDTMKRSDAHQSETATLNKALGKLKAWTESQMSGMARILTPFGFQSRNSVD